MIFWILFTLFCYMAEGQTAQELFLQANEQYKTGNYDRALEIYKKITHKGPAVWYNMGNCAYHRSETTYALLYWLKALAHSPQRIKKDSLYNCAQTGMDITYVSSLHLPSWIILICQIMFLLLLLIGILCLVRKKYTSHQYLMASLMGCIVLLGLFNYTLYTKTTGKKALTIQEKVSLYTGPGTEYQAICTIEEPDILTIHQQESAWAKVTWKTYTGWAARNTLELI